MHDRPCARLRLRARDCARSCAWRGARSGRPCGQPRRPALCCARSCASLSVRWCRPCGQWRAAKLDEHFPLVIWQTGSGTQIEHERQRGHRESRDRDGERRDGLEEADPSERRRQQGAVVERLVSNGDAHRGGARADRAAAGDRDAAWHARREGEGVREGDQDRPHALDGRDAADARAGDLGLGPAAREREGSCRSRAAAPLRTRARRHRGGNGPEHPSEVRRGGDPGDLRDHGLAVRSGAELLRVAGGARRAGHGARRVENAGVLVDEDRERRAVVGVGAALRARRDHDPGERAGQLDHAGQGQPDAERGDDDGLRAGARQRRRGQRRRHVGQLRAERLQAGHRSTHWCGRKR
jgi:hypothetical protein